MTSTTPAHAEHPGTAPAIAIQSVSRHFGPIRAVDGVDLEIRRGELFGLIGHNGAGKSTLFKMLLGLIPLSAGRILINGQDNAGRGFRTIRRSIGYLPENVVLYDNLSGLETLRFFARLKHVDDAACSAALEQVGLAHAATRRVREYSKGMRQRLGFAQALLGRPRLLFLDEPTNGLDPEAIRAFYASLRRLRDDGVTIVLTSHILTEIQERVDRLAIMAAGRIQAVGTVQALREQMDLPLSIEVTTIDGEAGHAAAERIRAALAPLGLAPIVGDGLGGVIRLDCPRPLKLAALQALTALGDGIRDLSVHEPSLEDVFFGFAD
ncbi:MAG: ABC transporter ATP-binding protein [Rhodocyclaceae bacterium]